MGKFKDFVVLEAFQSNRDRELQQIWGDTFKALGVGGLSDEDAAQQSLGKITFGSRSPDRGQTNIFKGKQAVRKRLENSQIFQRLDKIPDPEIRKSVEDARRWLDTQDDGLQGSNASTTIAALLQKLFGQKYYHQFIDKDMPRASDAKAQVQAQPPKNTMGQEMPTPAGSMDQNTPQPGPPATGMMGQQPQAPMPMMAPRPNNPMPMKPAGAELGMF